MTDPQTNNEQIKAAIEDAVANAPAGHVMYVVTAPEGIEMGDIVDKLPVVLVSMAAVGFATIVMPTEGGGVVLGFYEATDELRSAVQAVDNHASTKLPAEYLETAVATGEPGVARVAGLSVMEMLGAIGFTGLEKIFKDDAPSD